MKLYTSDKAVNPERVMRFIAEKGARDDFEYIQTSIIAGEHKSKEFRQISPLAQLPALVLEDGTKLTESKAICVYLEGIYPEPNLFGNNPVERAKIEMWDRRVEFLLMISVAMAFRHTNPHMKTLEDQVPEFGEKNLARADKLFSWFDCQLAHQDFIAGDRFSLADITAWCTTGFARVIGKKAFDLPNWAKWRERVADHPAMQ